MTAHPWKLHRAGLVCSGALEVSETRMDDTMPDRCGAQCTKCSSTCNKIMENGSHKWPGPHHCDGNHDF